MEVFVLSEVCLRTSSFLCHACDAIARASLCSLRAVQHRDPSVQRDGGETRGKRACWASAQGWALPRLASPAAPPLLWGERGARVRPEDSRPVAAVGTVFSRPCCGVPVAGRFGASAGAAEWSGCCGAPRRPCRRHAARWPACPEPWHCGPWGPLEAVGGHWGAIGGHWQCCPASPPLRGCACPAGRPAGPRRAVARVGRGRAALAGSGSAPEAPPRQAGRGGVGSRGRGPPGTKRRQELSSGSFYWGCGTPSFNKLNSWYQRTLRVVDINIER